MFPSFLLWLPFSSLRSPFLLLLFVILAGAYTNESAESKIRAEEGSKGERIGPRL